jgi:hypothetical protein
MSNITELNIPPKKIEEKYKGEVIHIEFDPEIKRWNWKFTVPANPLTIHGTGCVTPEQALKDAKKKVDAIHGNV